MTIAHGISRCMPTPLARWLQPKWYFLRNIWQFVITQHRRLRYDKDISCWVVRKTIQKTDFEVPIRSFRELRRVMLFGENTQDIVYTWLNAIDDCEVLYDIGAANGHEGFTANALHGCTVAFVEIFTPSIESILKGVVLAQQKGADVAKFEVFAAGIDRESRYAKVHLHNPPVAGGTYNTFDDADAYARGGRSEERVWASQWCPAVSIDSLHKVCGLPLPTHVVMDVDGFEDRAIEGAEETLNSGHVRSWMIEISPGRLEAIENRMSEAGYVEILRYVHYPDIEDCADHLFVRKDLAEEYRGRMDRMHQVLFGKN